MTVIDQLRTAVDANPSAREIVVTPRKLAELRKELLWLFRRPFADYPLDVVGCFEGLPIRCTKTSIFCRNCGAPIEPVCSYCKSAADYVELH